MINGIIKQAPKQISDFKLITKIKKADISQIDKNKHWHPSKSAVSFDYIEIGKDSDASFSREVITFYDDKGKLISRIFRENGKNTKQRNYLYEGNKKIISDMLFDSSRITEKVNDMLYNIGGVWKKNFELTQWITRISGWTRNRKVATELHTRRVDYNPQTELIDKITLTQYPTNLGFSKGTKKYITGEFNHCSGMPVLKKATYSKNLKLDFDDKYLKYRFFDLHRPDGISILTKGMLEDNGLEILRINIFPNSIKVDEKRLAFFNPNTKEICFSPSLTTPDKYVLETIDCVAHEVEHAKQFALIGRRGNGCCDYEFEAFLKLGELKTPEEKEEALKYFIAKGDYSETGDKYTNNYLEVKAREAGKKAAYDFQFPVENFDFFERFN